MYTRTLPGPEKQLTLINVNFWTSLITPLAFEWPPRGLSVTIWVRKGVFQWQSHNNKLSFSEMHRGFRGKNGHKFLNILSKLSKISKNHFFCRKLSLVCLLNAKMRGLWVTKICQGLSRTRTLFKIGGHWVKVGEKVGVCRWKRAIKSRVFLVPAHGA